MRSSRWASWTHTAERTVEVRLPAASWLEAAKKDPAFAAQGAPVPMAAVCEIAYTDKQAGSVEVIEATLTEPGPAAPNLLPNGGEPVRELF